MKTIIKLIEGTTEVELIPENEFEKNFVKKFDVESEHLIYKENINHLNYAYDGDKKLRIIYSETKNQSGSIEGVITGPIPGVTH